MLHLVNQNNNLKFFIELNDLNLGKYILIKLLRFKVKYGILFCKNNNIY